MKKYIALLMALSILNMSGCGNRQNYENNSGIESVAKESSQESVTESLSETSIIENHALISSGLNEALTDEVMFCVRIYVNYPPDTDLSAKTVETFKHEDSLTYLYIVPRYSGSSIVIEGIGFDESRNDFVTTGQLYESVCTDDYALLVQAELPEAGPRLRIMVTYNDMTASYMPAYDGRGDTVYPYVKNGVLIDEAPYSATNEIKRDNFETAIAQFDESEIVVDNAYADPLKNVESLKSWIADYRQGKPAKAAVYMDGMGFPSNLYVFESDGGKTYTMTSYRDMPVNGSSELPPPSIYTSSMVVERAYDYIFGADYPADNETAPLVIHNRTAPVIEESDWNPATDKLFGQISTAQAEDATKEVQERIDKYSSVIPSFYAGGYYLRESVINEAGDYSGSKYYYKVTGAIKIDGEPFYVVHGNQDEEDLERGEHGGSIFAVSGDGSLVFIQSMVDGRWVFVDDKNEKVIVVAR